MMFEDMGFRYIGPVNGHDIEKMESILKIAKNLEGPILIHVVTKKGKGYKPAEENPDKFHATGPFDLKTGKPKKAKGLDYSKVFGNKLVEMAEKNDKIVAITASMKDGTGLTKFQKQFPKRFFDIGIAEQHAITLAAGMATQGLIPFVPIYSSFYQRAYDQVIHDIAIQNLHVIMCVDRAGIVGADGETHQGLLDMAFFRLVPNLIIMAPKDFKELEDMLEFAVKIEKPVVIRYPRGGEDKDINFETHNKIEFGKAEVLKEFNKDISSDEKNKNEQCIDEKNNQNIKNQIVNKGQECAQKNVLIIAIGKMVARAMKIAEQEEKKGNNVCVVNSRFLKPLDRNKILQLLKESNEVITIEDGTIINGLGTAIKEIIAEENFANIEIKTQAYPDDFIQHGSVEQLESMYLGGIHG